MRGLLLVFSIMLVTAAATLRAVSAPILSAGTSLSAATSLEIQDPPKDVNVDINVNRSGGPVWYRSPVWIAIGVLALVVLLLVIVLATRGGGGTTIVRD